MQASHFDLAWVLAQPSLMVLPTQLNGLRLFNYVSADTYFQHSLLESASHRLGHYYEALVATHLEHSQYIIEIKRNTQVIDKGITKGEFDFLGRIDHQGQLTDFHLECAIKFYLLDGDPLNLFDYVGTNRNDSLGKKWARLRDHQSQLSQTPVGAANCEALGYSNITPLILVQGMAFFPYDQEKPAQISAEINPESPTGWWLNANKLDLLINKAAADSVYQILVKPNWLSGNYPKPPCVDSTNEDPLTSASVVDYFAPNSAIQDHSRTYTGPALKAAIDEHFAISDKAILLRQLKQCEAAQNGALEEVSRGFIVADDWQTLPRK